ncbi:MAG: ParA family protein [Elusimicrobia bacterium]|nr:ParA family protein [Elusimicrobiota bacterium]
MTETIVIANQKGGVGKTTTTINLAAGLATLGYPTLMIDTDPQGNATSGLGFDKVEFSPNIYNVVVELTPLEKTIRATTVPNLCLVGANSDLLGSEIALATAIGRESRLRGALSSIRDKFRFVIIDCPPSLGILTINALNAADKVIIPIQGEYYALEGLAQFVETINRVRDTLNPKLALEGGLLTMFDTRMLLSNQVKDEVSKFFGPSLFNTVIPRNIRLAEAPGFGQSIFQYDPKSRGGQAYLALAQEFLSRRDLKPQTVVDAPQTELAVEPQTTGE